MNAHDVVRVARLWDLGPTGAEPLREGESSTWRVATPAGLWVLRLTRASHRSHAQLEAELDFVEHLAGGGMKVARPARTPGGQRVLDVSDLLAREERTWATLFRHARGRHFEYHSADIAAPLFRAWGETMARVHELSRTFQPRPGFRRPEWLEDPVAGCPLRGAGVDDTMVALRHELVGWLRDQKPDPLHYGMVHGDFERTNFVLDGGSIRLFDFDDCCRHWFAWDLACALWVFRNAPREERGRILGWCLDGYASVRPPDGERLARFSDLIRLRTIALLLRRLHDDAQRAWTERVAQWLRSPWSW